MRTTPSVVHSQTILVILLLLTVSTAQNSIALGLHSCPQLNTTGITTATNPEASKLTIIEADSVAGKQGDFLKFDGNVTISHAGKTISADHAGISENPRKIRIHGAITVSDQDMIIKANEARIEDNDKESRFTDVVYRFRNQHAYGRATEVRRRDNAIHLDNASYTTCPGDNPAWELKSNAIKLDKSSGFGTARNARFTFKGMTLLYTPYVSFPIDDRRKTGFLFPKLGQSNLSGLELSVPYYWNINPQYDATVTPHFMSRRGLMLENEFRYLGSNQQATIKADYLPHDRLGDSDRYLYSLDHKGKLFSDHWDFSLNGSIASDDDYLEDFGNSLGLVSTSFLTRQAVVHFHDNRNDLTALLRAYQIVDPNINDSNRPYHLLPRITLGTHIPSGDNALKMGIVSEYSRFSHPQKIEGQRLSVAPTINWNTIDSGYYIKPSLSWYLTQYQLDDKNISRSIPLISVDSGIYLDRRLKNNSLLTLEPRAFYLYAPHRNQDDIPLFDTSEPSFSVASLFRKNRFSGNDRVGDANQVSLALTARYFGPQKNDETLTASVGQIFYIKDPQVTLDNTSSLEENRSGFVSEITVRPVKNIFFRSSFSMDSDWRRAENINATLGFKDENNRIFNIEHVFHVDDVEQTGISFAWPFGDNWRGFGRWIFSHRDQSTLEVLSGLEYESCCWKLRLVNQRYITDTGNDYNDNIFVQLVFKGVASVGEASDLLETEISGYSSHDK